MIFKSKTSNNPFDLGRKSTYGALPKMSLQPLVQFWIWISAFATLAGWTLSACGELNRTGYVAAFIVFAVFIFGARKNAGLGELKGFRFKKFCRRFRRLLPLCFAAFVILITLSGIIYLPDNYTGLTYRVPRVLQWLAHGHWFWIHTTNYRMNDRACGVEWLTAPLLLFTKSTRLLFLFNFLPFLLLPGLVFSICTRLGVRARVAWQWMWLLPTGYDFLLQAGSAANDTFPTVYALAALDFALRARKSKNFSDVANSLLSAALLTGAKASNLPLLLPCAIVIATSSWWRTMRGPIPARLAVCLLLMLIASVISFLPMAILNTIYCHDWSGAVLEQQHMAANNPVMALVGNIFQYVLQNFCPPVFPWAAWWNEHAPQMAPHVLVSVSNHFIVGFFELGELPTEDSAGLGFGLSVLLTVVVLAKLFYRQPLPAQEPGSPTRLEGKTLRFWVMISPWLALLFYSCTSGMTTAARLIAPYYPLLLPLILVGVAPSKLMRSRAWHILVFGNMVLAFAVLITTPPRPLWPAQTVLARLVSHHPNSHSLSRAKKVYTLYSRRYDPLPGVRDLLPPNISVVGFAGGTDDAEISFWMPFGSRRVEDFLVTDSPSDVRKRGIEYAILTDMQIPQDGLTLDDGQKKNHAELLATTHATLKISTGEQTFYLVRFK